MIGGGRRKVGWLGAAAIALGLLPAVALPQPAQAASSGWTQVTPPAPALSPPARGNQSLAFDAKRSVTVLFGGWNGTGDLGDTWEWNGTSWTQKSFPAGAQVPPARHSAAMAYDPATGRILLFGGATGSILRNDTWEYDGNSWIPQIVESRPSPRFSFALASDTTRSRVVLFGGQALNPATGAQQMSGETWEWTGTYWLNVLPATAPTPRAYLSMAYDSARKRSVLFSGYDGSSDPQDTWEYDGLTWTRAAPSVQPGPRGNYGMHFDSARNRTVVMGGCLAGGVYADTWEWDGATWVNQAGYGSPGGRFNLAMAFDSSRQRGVLFGGGAASSCSPVAVAPSADTWELAIPMLFGIARCGLEGPPLPGATVQILSDEAVVATTNAAANGAWSVTPVAPNATYGVRYSYSPPEGIPISCATTVTTDANGLGSPGPGTVVTNRKDHTWLKPCSLAPGVTWTDYLSRSNQSVWCQLAISPHQRVSVSLDSAPGRNYTLTLYRDLRALADARLTIPGDLRAVQQLTASGLHDVASDDIGSDDIGSDDIGSDDIGSDDIGSDDIGSDDIGSDDIGSDDIGSDDIGSPDLARYGEVYKAVQTQGLLGVASRPAGSKAIVFNTRSRSGSVYIRVHGKAGTFDPANPFRLLATVADSLTCAGAPLARYIPVPLPAPPAASTTLILTHTGRVAGVTAANRAAFLASLGLVAARPEVSGLVVDLAGDPNLGRAYADWDANKRCVAEANLLTDAIRDLVNLYRTPSLQYLVLAGSDAAIPYRRVVDHTELANEARYNPPLDPSSAGEAALLGGYFLTNDYYAATRPATRFADDLYLPDFAVSRLVESASDITAYINSYLGHSVIQMPPVATTPISALSTGYSFANVLATTLTRELRAGGVGVDDSLNFPGEAVTPGAWNSDDLRARLLGPNLPHYGVVSLQGHFSANRLVPADNGSRLSSAEVAAVADGRFQGTLVLSIGCHSGYNIQDGEATQLTQPVAFPEAFLSQGATLLGQSGYGYGDTVLLKNSELLMAKLVRELRYRSAINGVPYGAGGVPVGKGLANAKAAYLGELGAVRGIDLKVVGEATLYGLPMQGVSLPSLLDRPAPAPLTVTPPNARGLSTADVKPSFGLHQNPPAAVPATPAFFDAGGALGDLNLTQTIPGRPILPRALTPVAASGTVARGAVLLGASYRDVPFTPQIAIPVTDQPSTAAPGLRYTTPVLDPVQPWFLNDLAGQNLVVTPFQYLSNPAGGSPAGTARLFNDSSMSVRIYYSNLVNGDPRCASCALVDAPRVFSPSLSVVTDSTGKRRVHVDVLVGGLSSTDVQDVYVTYTAGAGEPLFGTWTSSAAARSGADQANGTGGFLRHYVYDIDPAGGDPLAVRVFIQAAGGNGLVGVASNNGAYFQVAPSVPTLISPKDTTAVRLVAPAAAAYRAPLQLSATLTDVTRNVPLAGRPVTFKLGTGIGSSSMQAVTSASGVATATLAVNVEPSVLAYQVSAAYGGDADALASGDRQNLTVSPAATEFTVVASPAISYPGAGDLGTLNLAGGGKNLNEQFIRISLTDQLTGIQRSAAALTDGTGHVRLDSRDFTGLGPGSYRAQLDYAGGVRYLASTRQLNVQVTVPATIGFGGGPQPVGPVTLSAILSPNPPCPVCDLTRGQISFTLAPDAGSAPPPVVVRPGPDGRAVAVVNLPAGVYTVTAAETSGLFPAAPVSALVPVFDPLSYTAGYGTFTSTSSTGLLNGDFASLAFAASYFPDGIPSPVAAAALVLSRSNFSFEALDVPAEWLAADLASGVAEFQGQGMVNFTPGYTYRVTAVHTAAGQNIFKIRIWGPGGSFAAPTYATEGVLASGVVIMGLRSPGFPAPTP